MQADMMGYLAVVPETRNESVDVKDCQATLSSYATRRTLRLVVPRAADLDAWTGFLNDVRAVGDDDVKVDVILVQWITDADAAHALSEELAPTLFFAPDAVHFCRVMSCVPQAHVFSDVSALLAATPGMTVEMLTTTADRLFSLIYVNPDVLLNSVDAAVALLPSLYAVAAHDRQSTREYMPTIVDEVTGAVVGVRALTDEENPCRASIRFFPTCRREHLMQRALMLCESLDCVRAFEDMNPPPNPVESVKMALRIA